MSYMYEREFVLLKPNAIRRGLVGEIISRLEKKGLKITAIKMLKMSKEMAEKLYAVHKGKDFYDDLISFITSGPVVVLLVEGPRAIEVVRKLIGATDPVKADPGTIRGDYALSTRKNLVHASDSKESADYEWKIFFSKEEINEYTLDIQRDI